MKTLRKNSSRLIVQFILGVILVEVAAWLFFTWLLKPGPSDIQLMAILLSLTSLISILAGYEAYHLGWINHSPRLQITLLSGYVLSILLTFLNVWVAARLMFTSQHDLLLTTVLLLFAGGIGIILGIFFTGTLTTRIKKLGEAAHQIANGKLNIRVASEGRDEMAQLADSFNSMVAQLEETEKQKKELDTLRKDLVAWVGHDLRTPLASIRAIVEALADGLVEDPETTRRYLITARKDIQSLSTLIDDLFQMAQLDAGGLQLDLTDGSLSDLISDTLESFSELAKRQSIRLEGKVEQGIDPVFMDVQRIGRVLNNLVNNALRYTPAGGRVFIEAIPSQQVVQVNVIDSGIGIMEKDAPHIFEQFYRGEKSRSRSGGGSGLGLAIARGIIEAHGGEIFFASQPGNGTSFSFTLPLTRHER